MFGPGGLGPVCVALSEEETMWTRNLAHVAGEAERISFAVRSGRLAARILWETGSDPQDAKALYHAGLQETMLDEIRLGRRLARLLFLPRKIRPVTMRLTGQRVAERLADVFCGVSTYRKLMASPRGRGRPLS